MNLRDCLWGYTVAILKPLANLCDCRSVTRKDELLDCIVQSLSSPDGQRKQWAQMDDLSRKALAQAVHNDGEFSAGAFQARYGRLPDRPQGRYSWQPRPIRLDLFIHQGHIPEDLLEGLESWVPRPEPFKVEGLSHAPLSVKHGKHDLKLIRVETESIGQEDLRAFLSLVESEKLRVSTRTFLPLAAAVKKILPVLSEGEYAELPEAAKPKEFVRPVGLTVFALNGGLAKHAPSLSNDPMMLTDRGRRWLRTQDPQLLLDAFETWTASDSVDELDRISAIRGLRSANTLLSPSYSRRERVIEALSWCPTGVWIDIEEFFRAIKIWQLDFPVELTAYSNLRVGSGNYWGEYWGDATSYWRITHGLYVLVVLWEYLATIGAIDISYLPPDEAEYDTRTYFDELYYSLYDGLRYFRITDLGAYLLGQESAYAPPSQARPPFLHIDRDLVVHIVAAEHVTPADRLALEAIATRMTDGSYRIDLASLLEALDARRDLQDDLHRLTQWHAGPLPEELIALVADARARGEAFATPQPAFTVQVTDPALAQLVVEDAKLKRYCRLAGDRTIVIMGNRERAFRTRLQELGYIVPRP